MSHAAFTTVAGAARRHRRLDRFERIVRAVSERDRAWFVAHPDRDSYVRGYIPGEFWPDAVGDDDAVLVTCYRDPLDGSQLLRTREILGAGAGVSGLGAKGGRP